MTAKHMPSDSTYHRGLARQMLREMRRARIARRWQKLVPELSAVEAGQVPDNAVAEAEDVTQPAPESHLEDAGAQAPEAQMDDLAASAEQSMDAAEPSVDAQVPGADTAELTAEISAQPEMDAQPAEPDANTPGIQGAATEESDAVGALDTAATEETELPLPEITENAEQDGEAADRKDAMPSDEPAELSGDAPVDTLVFEQETESETTAAEAAGDVADQTAAPAAPEEPGEPNITDTEPGAEEATQIDAGDDTSDAAADESLDIPAPVSDDAAMVDEVATPEDMAKPAEPLDSDTPDADPEAPVVAEAAPDALMVSDGADDLAPDIMPEEPVETPSAQAEEASAETAAEPEPVADVPSPESMADHPLAALPGAGPGLIWMLTQCGIHSLDDLADADAGVLRGQMGVIGQLVNLDSWTAYARAARQAA